MVSLRNELHELEQELHEYETSSRLPLDAHQRDAGDLSTEAELATSTWTASSKLESHEYEQYGRQMIMPEVGLQGNIPARPTIARELTHICPRTAET